MNGASSSDPGRTEPAVRVLVVDDEPVTAAAHAAYVERIDGLVVAGVVHDGRQTLAALRRDASAVDLVLLDMNLPDAHGLQLVRALRAAGSTVDVIAVTAARETDVVRAAVSLGIVQYLIKPFAFAAFAERLEQYLAYRASLRDGLGRLTQADVDGGFAALHRPAAAAPPSPTKGISPATLDLVVAALRDASASAGPGDPATAPGAAARPPLALSAAEIAERTNLSRVTARRYLEHLADTGLAERDARYGTPGRPENGYRWR